MTGAVRCSQVLRYCLAPDTLPTLEGHLERDEGGPHAYLLTALE